MKKQFMTLSLVFMTITSLLAQQSFQVIEESLPYNRYANSFTTNIIGLNEGFVLYHWEKFIENHGGKTYITFVEKGNYEMHSKEVKFPLLNNEEVDIYTRVTPNKTLSGVLLTIWIKTKDGVYFSSKSHPDQAKKIKNWLLAFNRNLEELNDKIIHN